jgi:class 3 adenylate cyclase
VELTPLLSESEYVLRSAQLPYSYRLRAMPGKGTTNTEIVLSQQNMTPPVSQVRAGRNVLTITNDYDREIVIRLERSIPQDDVVTAAQASSLPIFRDLFPNESPELGRLINVSTVTLLAIDLFDADRLYEELDDVEAYACVRRFHSYVEKLVAEHSGGIVKVMGTEILLVFDTPIEIMNLLAALIERLKQDERSLQLSAAVHRGTALATSSDEQMDYFGSTVHLVRRILQLAGASELLMTEAFAADPLVVQEIKDRNLATHFTDVANLGRSGQRVQRVTLS